MPILTEYPIDSISDSILDSVKVTTGYFPSGVGQLNAALIYTGSLADSNESFYFNIVDNKKIGTIISKANSNIFAALNINFVNTTV